MRRLIFAASSSALRLGLALALASALLPASSEAAAPPETTRPLRLLLPHSAYGVAFEKALDGVISEYNRANPKEPVQVIRRGENGSSLRELVARHLAGDTPDIAAIETSELPSIESSGIALPIPAKILGQALQTSSPTSPAKSVPFLETAPCLFVRNESLQKAGASVTHLPKTWAELTQLVDRVSESLKDSKEQTALALPLQGAQGLWIFEALTSKPLWFRVPGGLKTNREIDLPIQALQKWVDHPWTGRPDENFDRAIHSFLDGRSAILVGSTDLIPYLSAQATFSWSVTGLPAVGANRFSRLIGGTRLVVTRDRPDAWRFLEHLYSLPRASKWVAAGGFLPLSSSWLKRPEWKKQVAEHPRYQQFIEPWLKNAAPPSLRTTDQDVMRARSEWIRALHLVFGDRTNRLPMDQLFTRLDSTLTAR